MRDLLFLFFAVSAFCAPSWLPSVGGSSSSAAAIKPKIVAKTVRDTLRVIDTVYVDRIDTVVKSDTVMRWNAQHKYTVRYALTSLDVDLSNPEWLDYASASEIVARDTATLRIGTEQIRTLGNIIDQFGNKIPQTDIVTSGFAIQILKDKVVVEYRGKNSVALFSGNFDPAGFLIATGEISETNFLASFFPFSLFFGAGKKKIIVEIIREAYL